MSNFIARWFGISSSYRKAGQPRKRTPFQLVLLEDRTVPAVFEVTSLAASGTGSLQAAIAGAASGDTIDFQVAGTVNLGSVLSINKNLTITGLGAGEDTISGQGICQIFNVSTANTSLTLNGLTLADGPKRQRRRGRLCARGHRHDQRDRLHDHGKHRGGRGRRRHLCRRRCEHHRQHHLRQHCEIDRWRREVDRDRDGQRQHDFRKHLRNQRRRHQCGPWPFGHRQHDFGEYCHDRRRRRRTDGCRRQHHQQHRRRQYRQIRRRDILKRHECGYYPFGQHRCGQ